MSIIQVVRGVVSHFEGVRTGRKVRAKKAPQDWWSMGGTLPQKIYKFRVSEKPSPAIGHQ